MIEVLKLDTSVKDQLTAQIKRKQTLQEEKTSNSYTAEGKRNIKQINKQDLSTKGITRARNRLYQPTI